MKRLIALLPLLFMTTIARADIDLPPSQVAGGNYTTIFVANASGFSTHTSLTGALSAASAGDTVFLPPGTYSDDYTIPTGVYVRGDAVPQAVRITGHVTMGAGSTLRDVLSVSPNDATPGIEYGGSSTAILINVNLQGAGSSAVGVANSGSGTILARTMTVLGGTFDAVVDVSSGEMSLQGGAVVNGTIADIFRATGGVLKVYDVAVRSGTITDGAHIGAATVDLDAVDFGNGIVTNVMHLVADGHTLSLLASRLTGATWDWLVDGGLNGSGSTLRIADGCAFRLERTSYPTAYETGADIAGGSFDAGVQDDKATRHFNDLSVGLWNRPAEIAIGHGDSTTLGMVAFNYDASGAAYTDITDELASASGSTATLFGGSDVGDRFYLGSTLGDWVNAKFDVTTAMVLGSASVTVEYYNGAWTTIRHMSRDADDDVSGLRKSYDANLWARVQADHWHLDRVTDWAETTVNGTSAHWVRFTIANAAMTTRPVLERVKLGRSRRELSEDGTEAYGDAEQWRTWWSGTGESLSAPNGGANAPADFDVTISSTVNYRQAFSAYANGSDARHAGTMLEIPVGLDTSRDVECSIVADTDGTDTNTVQWRFDHASVSVGDTVGSIATIQSTKTMTPGGAAGKLVEVSWDVDVSGVVPGDFLAFNLYRLGSTDANSDTARMYTIECAGWFWQ